MKKLVKKPVKRLAKVNEAGAPAKKYYVVDDKYMEEALAACAPLKDIDPHAYELAEKYLSQALFATKHKMTGGTLAVSPAEFAAGRIAHAESKLKVAPDPADEMTSDQRREQQLAKVQAQWDQFKKDQDAARAEKNAPKIKSVWIKDLYESPGKKKFADIQITYLDGTVKDYTSDMTVSEGDFYFKDVKRDLVASRRAAHDSREVTIDDVLIATIRIQYTDPGIAWFIGKAKAPMSKWTDDKHVSKSSRTPSSVLARDYRQYMNGNVKYYKTV